VGVALQWSWPKIHILVAVRRNPTVRSYDRVPMAGKRKYGPPHQYPRPKGKYDILCPFSRPHPPINDVLRGYNYFTAGPRWTSLPNIAESFSVRRLLADSAGWQFGGCASREAISPGLVYFRAVMTDIVHRVLARACASNHAHRCLERL
jgi:hypothetical protein